MENKILKDNSGFSLLELIVGVLILGIISAVAITSFNTVFNARSDAAAEVAASVLKQTRAKAMALVDDADSTTYAKFYVKGNDYYVDLVRSVKVDEGGTPTVKTTSLVSKKLGNDGLTLTFRNHSVTTRKETVTATNEVIVYFDRITGGIKKISGSADYSEATSNSLDEFLVEGSGGDKKVILVNATGRCYMPD